MKEILLQQLRAIPDTFRRRSRAREYLQGRILLSLQDQGAFADWAFLGGTALRFLFNLPRYSEDLDFSLAKASDARFERRIARIARDLQTESYTVDTSVRADRTVATAFIRFRGLLHEASISPHRDATLSVKIEIDTKPPEGAGLATTVIRRDFLHNLQHYDRASLLAGKLHALLARRYTKGRDLYDLVWYLSDRSWPEPNLPLLQNALEQTGWAGPQPEAESWRDILSQRLDTLDWQAALADVDPFLERPSDSELIRPEIVRNLLQR